VAVGSAIDGLLAVSIALLLSASVTRVAIAYARRRQLIDLPGQRRSHVVPTPRGGGIGIVVAILAVMPFASTFPSGGGMVSHRMAGLACALALVAAVGWVDDHRGLGAPVRLVVHAAAAIVIVAAGFAWPLLHPEIAGGVREPGIPLAATLLMACPVVVAIIWSINLHNFMDGIDGILSFQAIFVFLALAWLCGDGASGPWLLPIVFAAAVAGFLPFNFPHARVFMGDIGSGALGLLIAVSVIACSPDLPGGAGLVLCAAFVTDATLTLLSRMLRGRRWYSAHREHLYQWLARSGFSHAGVVVLYMGWNLLVALPVAWWMSRMPNDPMIHGIIPAMATYAFAAAIWWFGKRWCLRRARERSSHAVA
jgi:UDP-N-acetylmuramyl pentapeptide phosphotransferase/UDP-N-acetylglucosamine-1-phosphate transferase